MFLLIPVWALAQTATQGLAFQNFRLYDQLPDNEVRCLYHDNMGFVWIGTKQGLCRYDGYRIMTIRNTPEHPHWLAANSVNDIIGDHHERLWVATKNGLTRMNMRDGSLRHYHLKDFDNSDMVKRLLYSRSGRLWVGTEGGLYIWDEEADTLELLCNRRGNAAVPHCSVTCLKEDHAGYIWVGTWDKGLYRYNPSDGSWYELPRFNDANSAQCITPAKDGSLWVGTWGHGLYKILNPYDTGRPLNFRHYVNANTDGALSSDIIWRFCDDSVTHRLWVGTQSGLSYIDEGTDQPSALLDGNYSSPYFLGSGVNPLFIDENGLFWVNVSGKGILTAQLRPSPFLHARLPKPWEDEGMISCIKLMDDSEILVGVSNKGLLRISGEKNQYYASPSTLHTIQPLSDGRILVGTDLNGVMLFDGKGLQPLYHSGNASWLGDRCVYAIHELPGNHLLFGTWRGLSLLRADGQGTHFENLATSGAASLATARIRYITRSSTDTLWLGTDGSGIIRLTGDLLHPESLKQTTYIRLADSDFEIPRILRIVVDGKGRIWASSVEAGLLRYDAKRDAFISAGPSLGIPDTDIFNVESTADGSLWISARQSLIWLRLDNNDQVVGLRFFPRNNDVPYNEYFVEGASDQIDGGPLCFAGSGGYVCFMPHDVVPVGMTIGHKRHVAIVEIRVNGQIMGEGERHPAFVPAKTITLQPSDRELTISFSAFNFEAPDATHYAYRLRGFEDKWHYTLHGVNTAVYTKLPAGNFTFELRATDANGVWDEHTQRLQVHVLAPVYLRWYAWLLYLLIFAVFMAFTIAYLRRRQHEQREVAMARMEKEQAELLNHKKLQFYTNISHDLMTPLTIISSAVSQMQQTGQATELPLVASNTDRLMRMIQQLLEFRKAETGNLHLRVSRANLADFMRHELESIRPMARQRQIQLTLTCQPEQLTAYFDNDKLDKILFNLISNAVKYGREGGYIHVEVISTDGQTAIINVRDNGIGIAEDKLPQLFTRFYEGEHRWAHTFGNGIGLSLVRDLTQLHHGTVSVQSLLGEGSTFTLSIPIAREAYTEDEIEEKDNNTQPELLSEQPTHLDNNAAYLLLVEDNEELLHLLENLLSRQYHILTAYNGREAIEVLENERIDLVVTDVMMPIMDGVALTEEIRRRNEWKDLPVIMLTAKRDDEDRAEAYRAGASAYITKPFNTNVLLSRINNLLQQKKQARQQVNEQLYGVIQDVQLAESDQEFLDRCAQCVKRHLSDSEFELPVLAAEMAVSVSTLYKRIRSLTGQNTTSFIRSIRMKMAAELLRKNPNTRIADLAYAVGYSDPKYFSSCFKKEFGLLPREWLEQQNISG